MTGGASTFGSLFIAQRIVLKIENLYLKNGEIPPILRSANIPGGDEFNARLLHCTAQESRRFPDGWR